MTQRQLTRAASAVLLLLLQPAIAQHGVPSPNIQTENLPSICPAASGSFQVPDVEDPTSYYICCNQTNTVRKTCRYFTYSAGTYQPLIAAPYNAVDGQCGTTPAEPNPRSFRAPTSASPSLIDLIRYRFTPALNSSEAEETCAAAAAPPPSDAPILRQAGDPRAEGRWTVIKSANGTASTGVVAINAVLLPESHKVLLWTRIHMNFIPNYQPGVVASDGIPEVSAVYDTTTGTYNVKRMRLTPFCSGNSLLPDGRVFSAGGDDLPFKGYTDGRRGLRYFEKGRDGDWSNGQWRALKAQLQEPHWYPTQTLLPDGNRTVVTAGYRNMNQSVPVPSAEVFSHVTGTSVKLDTLAVLQRFGGYILFPLVYVLPYTSATSPGIANLFVFNCDGGAVMRLRPNNSWIQHRDIPTSIWPTQGFCGAMAMGGTATMLLLDPRDGYAAEVAMFGGFSKSKEQCNCDKPTSAYAHRMRLSKSLVDNNQLAWQREAMPYGRNLNDAVLLPNGQILLVNGAKSGIVDELRDPAYDAWLYNPKAAAGSRFRTLAASGIRRYYHSVALLLPDASILVAGSEYGDCTGHCARRTNWLFQHQAERFQPPYFFNGSRPVIASVSTKEARYGAYVTIRYRGTAGHAVLMKPAAVTHQVNMNQRAVRLVTSSRGSGKITVRMPPNNYITAPGWHMLFLMNRDVPCTQASWIRLRL